jgi:hypothetical protein
MADGKDLEKLVQEQAAQLKAQGELLAKMNEKLVAQEEAVAKAAIAATPKKVEKRKLVVPDKAVKVSGKNYYFQKAKFRLKMKGTFKTYISEDEKDNTELLEHIVKQKYTHLLSTKKPS